MPELLSFPTRRSSDLSGLTDAAQVLRRPPDLARENAARKGVGVALVVVVLGLFLQPRPLPRLCGRRFPWPRSEEHTSELQSRGHLVCRLLLAKKNHTE